MRVYKAAGGALVRAQRMEQTISPTLHGRTRTTALRGNICMYVCEREVTATAGMAGVTYVTFASVVGVRLCALLHQQGLCTAADSLSPEDISQKGRRRSRSNPEGCSFSQPSGSLSSFPLPSSPSPTVLFLPPVRVEGESFSFAPPSQGTTLQLE